MIFSRRRGSGGRHHRADDAQRTRHAGHGHAHEEFGSDDESSRPAAGGPYDVTEAPDGVERLDLGSLRIPAVTGVEVRLQADPEGQVQQVVLVAGENALQLGVFAAPRSEGIWDEVREEIRKQLFDDGVAVEQVDGAYGVELRSRVRTPEGFTDIRFVGIDGPRWMVRAVYQGPAAVDPTGAGPLAACLDGLVVDRGAEAMPVREPLPLRLPREVATQAQEADEEAGVAVAAETGAGAEPAGPSDTAPSPRSKPSPRPRRRA
ncbi:MAG TPA: DUF3710 domain-containing protein [Planosporangium sp.]|nr:DUF3710 domain-containing protein [Planosporangium sp.]